MSKRRDIRRLAWELWLPAVLIAAWLIISQIYHSLYFPPLVEILTSFVNTWFWQGTLEHIFPSVFRLLSGFVLGTAVAVVVGTFLGLWQRGEEAIRPIMEFLRATPGVALLPIAILFLGVGDAMKIFMIAFVSFWPVLLNTIDAIRSVEPVQLQVSRSFHLDRGDRLRFVLLPSAAPQVVAGARTGLAISVIAMVLTEMVGDPGGIGYFILNAQRTFATVDMWSGIVALGVVGYGLNVGFRMIERRVLKWYHDMNDRTTAR